MSNQPIIAAFDYSYTSPAIAVWDSSLPFKFENINFYALTKTKKYVGLHGDNIQISQYPDSQNDTERFFKISKWAEAVIVGEGVTHGALEAYSFGKGGNSKAQAGRVFQLAENTALLKQLLFRNNIPWDDISPTAVKKFFTGMGRPAAGAKNDREKKMPMILEAYERLGVKIHDVIGADAEHIKPVDDICDAFAILCFHELVPAEAKPAPPKPKKPKKEKAS